MFIYSLYIEVLMVLWSVTAVPISEQHRLNHIKREVVNNSSPLSDVSNDILSVTDHLETVIDTSIHEDQVKNYTSIITSIPWESLIDDGNDFTSLPIDNIYDYDYFNYFYDLDLLDPISATNVNPTPEQQRTSATNAAIKKNLNEPTIIEKKIRKFQQVNEVREDNTIHVKDQENKIPPTLNLTEENEIPTEVIISHIIADSPTGDEKKKDDDVTMSNTTSISSSLPSLGLNKSAIKSDDNSGWTSAGSSISYEVRVELSSSVSTSKQIKNALLLDLDQDSIARNNNYQTIEILELEVSATPKTFNLQKGRSIEKASKTFVDVEVPSDRKPIKTITEDPNSMSTKSTFVAETTVPTTTTSNYFTSKSLASGDYTSTTSKTTMTPSESILSTTKQSIKEDSQKSTTTMVHETATSFPMRRPFAFLRRFGKGNGRKLNLPPLFPRQIMPKLNTNAEPLTNTRTEQLRSPMKGATADSNLTDHQIRPTKTSTSNSRRRPHNVISKSLQSQLGRSPHGFNPSGAAPLGHNPQGLSPFGLSPQGLAPLGVRQRANMTAINVTEVAIKPSELTTNATEATDLTQERYHVQVKKPDGSINGDYIVLDHSTGSFSGVRYDAIDGADQSLIQQALLSFLSLDPGLVPDRQQKSLSIDSILQPNERQKSFDGQTSVILSRHFSEPDESSSIVLK